MTDSIQIIAEETRFGVGGVYANSLIDPNVQYFFDGSGNASLFQFSEKEVAAIGNGGGVYVLDPMRRLFSCLACHHYAISILSSSSLIVLMDREILETNLEYFWIWPVEIDEWLLFEDENIHLNEASAVSLWNNSRKNPAKQTTKIEFRNVSIPLQTKLF